MKWVAVATNDYHVAIRDTSLVLENGTYKLIKDGANTLEFELTDEASFVPSNRWSSSLFPGALTNPVQGVNADAANTNGVHYRWARATRLENSPGDFYEYEYGTASGSPVFLPTGVRDSQGALVVMVTASSQDPNLVGTVSDSVGNNLSFTYTQQNHAARHANNISYWTLTQVQRVDSSLVDYAYSVLTEEATEPPHPPKDPNFWTNQSLWVDLADPDLSPVEHYHHNLTSLTEGGETTTFTYDFNESLSTYYDSPWWEGEFVVRGLPMWISKITFDDQTESTFSLDSFLGINSDNNDLIFDQSGWIEVGVTDRSGLARTFAYEGIQQVRVDSTQTQTTSIYTTPFVTGYQSLNIRLDSSGSSVASFVPNLHAALSKVRNRLGSVDSDGDGYSNGWENSVGTDPYNASNSPTVGNPYLVDSDGDGYGNALESAFWGTNPDVAASNPDALPGEGDTEPGEEPDSDGDGIPDAWEIQHGLNPSDPNDALRDDDYDRLTNLKEYELDSEPVVDWSFAEVDDGGGLATLNDRGELVMLDDQEVAGVYTVKVFRDDQWQVRGSLGADDFANDAVDLRQNHQGVTAALLKEIDPVSEAVIAVQLRVLDEDGTTLQTEAIGAATGGELLKVTASGKVFGNYVAPDGFWRGFVWEAGTKTDFVGNNEDFRILDGSEPGNMIAVDADGDGYFWDGTQWEDVSGQVIALNDHGQALISRETIDGQGVSTFDTFLWSEGQAVPTGLALGEPVGGLLNNAAQFVIHGSGGSVPVFADPAGTQVSMQIPQDQGFQDPWVVVTTLNDLGEVAGSFYNSTGTPNSNEPMHEAYSWHMGQYLFRGVYDESQVLTITNSGFLAMGASKLVDEFIDYDGDGIPDQTGNTILEPRVGIVRPLNDLDENGLPDDWEAFYSQTDPDADSDGDNLTAWAEYVYRTKPGVVDSDGDGYSDGVEVSQGTDPIWSADGIPTSDVDGDGLTLSDELALGTRPDLPDSDFDGLDDGVEVNQYGTNPLKADSDDDGISDPDELNLGSDPNNPNGVDPHAEKEARTKDDDGDGLTNWQESMLGTYLDLPDSDLDGLSDFAELRSHRTHPLLEDSNGDGQDDSEEIAATEDPWAAHVLDPSDGDGDGYSDAWVARHKDALMDTLGWDEWDSEDWYLELESIEVSSPGATDFDSDGASAIEEAELLTDPFHEDSDRDGLHDGDDSNLAFNQVLIHRTYDYNETGEYIIGGLPYEMVEGTGGFADTEPLNPDTDGDLILDGTEPNLTWFQFLSGTIHEYSYDPNHADDGNWDEDGDGLSFGQELLLGLNAYLRDSDSNGILDGDESPYEVGAPNQDFDGDGILDGIEAYFGLDPYSALDSMIDDDEDDLGVFSESASGIRPDLRDSDGDGLSDGEEIWAYQTHPGKRDSDEDGVEDLAELLAGTNPVDWSNTLTHADAPPSASTVIAGLDGTTTYADLQPGEHLQLELLGTDDSTPWAGPGNEAASPGEGSNPAGLEVYTELEK